MALEKVNLDEKLALVGDLWSPKTIARMNDYELKLVKVQGEFVWHQHHETDEMFLVIDGELTIQYDQRQAPGPPGGCGKRGRVPPPTGSKWCA